MNDIVLKMNYVKNCNKIKELEDEAKLKDQRMTDYTNKCKNLIEEYKHKNIVQRDELKNKIKELEDANAKLSNEKDYYKNMLNSIPKFIQKLFCKKKDKLLTEAGNK